MIEDNIITKEYYNEFLKADLVTIYLWISIKNTVGGIELHFDLN